MRYSSALVLSTLAVGQAAAAHGKHASFHARRNAAASKRGDDWVAAHDWNDKKNYEGVDWSKINWNSVFNKGEAPATSSVYVAPPAPTSSSSSSSSPSPTPTPEPEPTKAAVEEVSSTTSSEKESETSDPVGDFFDDVGDFLEDVLEGVSDLCSKAGIKIPGINSKSSGDAAIWLGNSDYSATFANAGSDDVLLVCWKDQDYGFTVNVKQPQISIKLPAGKSQTLGFAPQVPTACSYLKLGSKLATFGGVPNTWAEMNFGGDYGTFDVSKNPNTKGGSVSMVGSKCTSDMNTCYFTCDTPDENNSCTYGYELYNCDASNGGGGGYDANMGGTGGGCSMSKGKENLKITINN